MEEKNIAQLVEEWHKTKSISVATEVCERLWRSINQNANTNNADN